MFRADRLRVQKNRQHRECPRHVLKGGLKPTCKHTCQYSTVVIHASPPASTGCETVCMQLPPCACNCPHSACRTKAQIRIKRAARKDACTSMDFIIEVVMMNRPTCKLYDSTASAHLPGHQSGVARQRCSDASPCASALQHMFWPVKILLEAVRLV